MAPQLLVGGDERDEALESVEIALESASDVIGVLAREPVIASDGGRRTSTTTGPSRPHRRTITESRRARWRQKSRLEAARSSSGPRAPLSRRSSGCTLRRTYIAFYLLYRIDYGGFPPRRPWASLRPIQVLNLAVDQASSVRGSKPTSLVRCFVQVLYHMMSNTWIYIRQLHSVHRPVLRSA